MSNGAEILIRNETEYDHLGGGFAFDDIDMLISEKDGSLIPVAMFNGVHVCQQCGEQFVDDPTSRLRMVEFNCGGNGVRIGLHSKCVKKAQKALQQRGNREGGPVFDMAKKHQFRRFLTRATRPFRKRDAG